MRGGDCLVAGHHVPRPVLLAPKDPEDPGKVTGVLIVSDPAASRPWRLMTVGSTDPRKHLTGIIIRLVCVMVQQAGTAPYFVNLSVSGITMNNG